MSSQSQCSSQTLQVTMLAMKSSNVLIILFALLFVEHTRCVNWKEILKDRPGSWEAMKYDTVLNLKDNEVGCYMEKPFMIGLAELLTANDDTPHACWYECKKKVRYGQIVTYKLN